MIRFYLVSFFLFANLAGIAQDTAGCSYNKPCNDPVSINAEYKKPAFFSFLTNIPRNIGGFSRQSLKKNNLPALGIIAATTATLLIFDQEITNSVHSFSKRNKINTEEKFSPLIKINVSGKQTNIGKWPKNINTAFYNIGQGSSVILIAGGLFIKGKITKDYRALQTASQLINAFITLGAGTQVLKYVSGRENPSNASVAGGMWRPFPLWHDFQNNKTKYDAFPSGHLATLVSAVTILSKNYSEIKWIKPVGYGIAGLCGLAMINNGVHWASDFPLGIALGYGYGKYISKKRRP